MTERQKVSLSRGYLLHARPYLDSSVIAEIFCCEYGRVALVARGVRRPKSKLRGLLQPFRPLLFSWVSKSSLGTLTELENDRAQQVAISGNLLSAYYLNELILRALRPGDGQPEIYELYQLCLKQLSGSVDEARILRVFERNLLDYLGYGLRLDSDINGNGIQSDLQYSFDVQAGATIQQGGRHAGTYVGSSLIDLAQGRFNTTHSLLDAKRLLRLALDHHLGSASSKVRQVMSSMNYRRRAWHDDAQSLGHKCQDPEQDSNPGVLTTPKG